MRVAANGDGDADHHHSGGDESDDVVDSDNEEQSDQFWGALYQHSAAVSESIQCDVSTTTMTDVSRVALSAAQKVKFNDAFGMNGLSFDDLPSQRIRVSSGRRVRLVIRWYFARFEPQT